MLKHREIGSLSVSRIVGLGLFQAWFFAVIISSRFYGEGAAADLHDGVYQWSIALELVVLCTFGLFPRIARFFVSKHCALWAVSSCIAVAPLVLLAPWPVEVQAPVFSILQSVNMVLLVAWALEYSGSSLRQTIIETALAYAFGSVFVAVMGVAPTAVFCGAAIVLPFAQTWFLVKGLKEVPTRPATEKPGGFGSVLQVMRSSSALMGLLVVIAVLSISASFFFRQSPETGVALYTNQHESVLAALATVLVLGIAAVISFCASSPLQALWRTAIFFLVSILLLQDITSHFSVRIVSGRMAFQYFKLLEWVLVIQAMRILSAERIGIFCIAQILYSLGSVVGTLAVGTWSESPVLLTGVSLVILFCYFFIFTEERLSSFLLRLNVASVKDSMESVVEVLAERYQLADREREIARLKALGYTNRKIGEELHLAPGTISSYQTRLYKKMDVHSRQEFVDVLMAIKDEGES